MRCLKGDGEQNGSPCLQAAPRHFGSWSVHVTLVGAAPWAEALCQPWPWTPCQVLPPACPGPTAPLAHGPV